MGASFSLGLGFALAGVFAVARLAFCSAPSGAVLGVRAAGVFFVLDVMVSQFRSMACAFRTSRDAMRSVAICVAARTSFGAAPAA